MGHQLEIKENGEASMFSGEGITPWHGLGKVKEGLATSAEAIEWAGLDWQVEKFPMYFGPDKVAYPGQHVLARTTDMKPFGTVSDIYQPFQNRDAFDFFDAVTDKGTGEAHYTAAGALKGGSVIFLTAQIGDTFNVCGEDAHKMFLLLTNAHNGKESLNAATTMVRGVCWNTVTLGLRSAKSKWTIPHKYDLKAKAAEAREALKLSFKYADAFEAEVEKMMKIQIEKDKFNKIVEQIVPESKTQHDRDVEILMDIFERETTVNDTNAKGTGWGAYNAVTFFVDHKKRYHTPESRFNSLIDGAGEKLRDKAHGMILAAA